MGKPDQIADQKSTPGLLLYLHLPPGPQHLQKQAIVRKHNPKLTEFIEYLLHSEYPIEKEQEIERIKAWGNFSPDEVTALKDAGYDLHFYRLGRNEYQTAVQDPEIRLIQLASIDKMHTVAVLGSLPPTIPATEFTLPEKGMDALVAEIEQCRQEILTCEETLKKASIYDASFQVQMLKAQNEENYSSASETSEHDEDFVWISGYLPETDLQGRSHQASMGLGHG